MDRAARFRLIRDGDRLPEQSRKARSEIMQASLFKMLEDATADDFEYLLFAAAEDRTCGSVQIDCPTRLTDYREVNRLWYQHIKPWCQEYCCIGLPIAMQWDHVVRIAFSLFHFSEIPLEVRQQEYLNVEQVSELIAKHGYEPKSE